MIDKTTVAISPVDVKHRRGIDVRAGDTVRVYSKVVEKGKTRLQAFEGLVIGRNHGSEPGATFTVRKIASGVGVERTFPLYSPNIEKIELVRRAKTRRAKLYFIREKTSKEIRKKMKTLFGVALPDFARREEEVIEDMPEEEIDEVIETPVVEEVVEAPVADLDSAESVSEEVSAEDLVEVTAPAEEVPAEEEEKKEETK
ncbi:MAG: 50S ribosomal protein L19 [Candidatus Yonathbacteria bacterium]|nr:50S ribosomal protein L19 [Candidatus Yonathbacteria bacterium]